LKAKVQGLADKIHTGRSRNEQVSLDVRWWLRGQIDVALDRLQKLMAELPQFVRSGWCPFTVTRGVAAACNDEGEN